MKSLAEQNVGQNAPEDGARRKIACKLTNHNSGDELFECV
jgi:hypothetical protein